ncbi:hypothetical protein V865_000050 [Kwoniella europaea PYCC6329]|uniref:Phosphatidylglycerol/phosphatidylinositol transfer protein n=1 Tax=Kwoniella europaea PYCC6329 TaxID=1423913 RepID=A0AAX4K6N1_9TREE
MIKSPLPIALLYTIAFLPNTLVVSGNVKINFPSDTSSQPVGDSFAVHLYLPLPLVTGPVAPSDAVGGSNGSGQSQVSWQQTCKVSVEDQFDGDVEFTLQLKEAGFKGPKDKHATIVCDQPLCHFPEGEKCEGQYVIPFVDSTV